MRISGGDQRKRDIREASKKIPSQVHWKVQMMVDIRRGVADTGIAFQVLLKFQTRMSSIQENNVIAIIIAIGIGISISISENSSNSLAPNYQFINGCFLGAEEILHG